MKKIILAALMFTITTALSGCGSSPSEVPAAIAPTPAPAAAKQVSVDVTRDFWGVSQIKILSADTQAPITTAIVTAGGVGLSYDPASSSYLKGATVAKNLSAARDLQASTDPQLTVDVSLDGVVTVMSGGESVTDAIVTVNSKPLTYYTRAYTETPPSSAPFVLASIYSFEGHATEMSVYTTTTLGGLENFNAVMSFNGNHLSYCNPGYSLGGLPVGEITNYENSLNAPIASGTTINFTGLIAGTTVSASTAMYKAPVIVGSPVGNQTLNPAVWNGAVANTITWAGANPVGSGTTFKLIIKTPMSLGGLWLGPVFAPVEFPALSAISIPSTATSFVIPAGTLPAGGTYAIYLGIQTTSAGLIPITNADASGGLQIQAYGMPLVVSVQ